MSNSIWETTLAKYFIIILETDGQIEIIRQELANNSDFYSRNVFDILDIDTKNFLSLNDFRNFLRNERVNYSDETLRRLIHNFDRDKDFAIDYDEFKNMLFPRKNDELLNLVSTRVSDQNISISREITKLICQIIEKELNLIEELADLADEMKNSKDFTTYEAFLRIENRNSKYINENTLSNFMKRNGYVLNQRDSFGIIYKLDNDGDGKISYEEFQEIFFPLKYAKTSTIEFRPRIEETTRNEINYDGDYDRTLSYANVFNNSNSTTFKYSNSNYYSAYQTGDIRYKRTIDMNKQNEEENEKENKNEQIENNQNYDDSKNEKNDLNNNEILNSEENEQNSQNENKVSEKEEENENERVIKINQNGNTITEENELSSNRLKTSYNDYLELRNSRINNQNNFYNSNSNLNPNNKYSLLSSTVRSPVQSYSRENLNRSKENLSSTLSSLRMGSPLKYSTNYNDELNARANLKTYTSPEKYRYISPERGVESASRMFNSRLDLSSNNIRTPNMNRSNTIERCDIKPRIVQLESKSPNIENSFAFNSSQRFFSPSRLNTTKYSGNYTFTTNARTNNLDVLSPRKNIDRTNVSYNKDKGYVLAKFLSDILSYDGISEVYRESISLKTEINLPDLFALFNFSNRNSISLVDFKEILKELDIYSSLNELKLVFKRYDINMDGRLDYGEFCEMITPKKMEYAKLVRNRLSPGYFRPLSYESKKNLTLLFRSIIDGEINSEQKRKILNSRSEFSSYENFEIIKGKIKSSVLKDDLYNFMHENGFFITRVELNLLFDRLDKNQDGKITFNEFINELVPRYKTYT